MKTLENGQDKIDKICETLRQEALEPAKKQAAELLNSAAAERQAILDAAKKEAEAIIQQARYTAEQELSVFKSSLEQASRQALERLRQDIEKRLFNDQLDQLLINGTSDVNVVAELITTLVMALEKEGIKADLTAIIPKSLTPQQVIAALGQSVASKLQKGGIEVGSFTGGARVKLQDKKMTFDISDQALKELLVQYVRKDFRDIVFGA